MKDEVKPRPDDILKQPKLSTLPGILLVVTDGWRGVGGLLRGRERGKGGRGEERERGRGEITMSRQSTKSLIFLLLHTYMNAHVHWCKKQGAGGL